MVYSIQGSILYTEKPLKTVGHKYFVCYSEVLSIQRRNNL